MEEGQGGRQDDAIADRFLPVWAAQQRGRAVRIIPLTFTGVMTLAHNQLNGTRDSVRLGTGQGAANVNRM